MASSTLSTETQLHIQQLALSLDHSTSGERLSALEELQHILKKPNTAHFIGQNALKSILQFLSQQQVSVEEYQEALDLIDRFFSIKNASSH